METWFSFKCNVPAFLNVLKEYVDIQFIIRKFGEIDLKDGFFAEVEDIAEVIKETVQALQWERIKNEYSSDWAIDLGARALDALLDFGGIAGAVVETVDAQILRIMLHQAYDAVLSKFGDASVAPEEAKKLMNESITKKFSK